MTTIEPAGPGQTGVRLVVAAAGAALAPAAVAIGVPLGFPGGAVVVALSAGLVAVAGLHARRLEVPRAEVTAATGYALGLLQSYLLTMALVLLTDTSPAQAALLTALPAVALAAVEAPRLTQGTAGAPDPDRRTQLGRTACVLGLAAAAAGIVIPLSAPAQERADRLDELATQVSATAVPLRVPDLPDHEAYDVAVRSQESGSYVALTYEHTTEQNRYARVELHGTGDPCQLLAGSSSDRCTPGPDGSTVVQEPGETAIAVSIDSGVVVVSAEELDLQEAIDAVETAERVEGRTVARVCDLQVGGDGAPFCEQP
ncbi:hypothetical protein RDV89_08820 [Nocardioides zeae]|uniref:Uncharacterized protein n=1 Tax=Nocardioides imazamoxiresistens TaxID=3231893 RepID=A0ABU3PVB6_9ACTN|nr:hypothetical protein [Nocardioides zeae]MDT9593168.1 hypothetical protein [Nocardioides zeae]